MNNYKVDEIAYLVTSSNLHSVPGMQASSVSSDQEVGLLQSNVSAFSQYVYRVEEYQKKMYFVTKIFCYQNCSDLL